MLRTRAITPPASSPAMTSAIARASVANAVISAALKRSVTTISARCSGIAIIRATGC